MRDTLCSAVVCVCDREREKRRAARVKTAQPLKGYIHQTPIYTCLLKHHTNTQSLWHSHTHTVVLFTGLDFGSSHSRAAFISVCLDTIYYQLFILVLRSVFLFVSLWAHYCWIFRQSLGVCVCGEARVVESVCLSVTLLLLMWVSFSCLSPKRKSVCVSCLLLRLSIRFSRVCGSPSGCHGL